MTARAGSKGPEDTDGLAAQVGRLETIVIEMGRLVVLHERGVIGGTRSPRVRPLAELLAAFEAEQEGT